MTLKDTLRKMSKSNLLVTPLLETWLVKHADDPLGATTAKTIEETLKIWPRDRTQSFSASSGGVCPRRQEFSFLGTPQEGSINTRLSMIFMDGKWRHLRWQAMLLQSGIIDSIEVPLRDKKLRIKGSMDGVGATLGHSFYGDDHDFGWELKGTNEYSFRSSRYKGPMEKHLQQIDNYFLVSGLDLFSLVYEDKNSQEWAEWVVVRDEARVRQARQNLVEMNNAIDTQTLHDIQPECKNMKGEYLTCPYGETCLKTGSWWTP